MSHPKLIVTVAALLVVGAQAEITKPDFSGIWILDLAKSQFSSMETPDSIELKIVHKEPSIVLSSVRRSGRLETTSAMTLTANGLEEPNEVETADGPKKTRSITKWEGGKLVTIFRVPHIGHQDDFRDAWDLSADGSVLTIVREASLPNSRGEVRRYVIRMVYKKR